MYSTAETIAHNLPSQSVGRYSCFSSGASHPNPPILSNRAQCAFVEIMEQPVSIGARFRYKCEGRSAGCIRGINSTEKQKTFPTIRISGYQGAAGVVVSCVTKDGPPYYPHPHNLVGKTCTNGVCYKSINNPDMVCNFTNLGIQCVKKKDIKESLSQREAIQVDPFGTGFSHHAEPNKINLNALRLCFQVFLPDENGKLSIPLQPVISNPIFDNKTVSDLTITKLSHDSSPVTGGQETILLCDQVNKDDIQILFYEEFDGKVVWCGQGKFSPHHVHRKAAISFQTPQYKNPCSKVVIDCFVQLRRPSDGAVGKPMNFSFQPLKLDPDGMARKRSKFEALKLDRVLQPNNICPNNGGFIQPRTIKHAVRSKMNNLNSSSFLAENIQQLSSSAQMGANSVPLNVQIKNASLAEQNIPCTSSNQKVEEIIAIAKEQLGLGTSFCEVSGEEALDKLSSLDLGIDPNDLDVNLSGINLDSFSESSGLGFSHPLLDVKNSLDKI